MKLAQYISEFAQTYSVQLEENDRKAQQAEVAAQQSTSVSQSSSQSMAQPCRLTQEPQMEDHAFEEFVKSFSIKVNEMMEKEERELEEEKKSLEEDGTPEVDDKSYAEFIRGCLVRVKESGQAPQESDKQLAQDLAELSSAEEDKQLIQYFTKFSFPAEQAKKEQKAQAAVAKVISATEKNELKTQTATLQSSSTSQSSSQSTALLATATTSAVATSTSNFFATNAQQQSRHSSQNHKTDAAIAIELSQLPSKRELQ